MQKALAGLRYENNEYVLVQPFIQRIKRHNTDSLEECMEYFIKTLLAAIKTVRRKEIVTVWAKDQNKYKLRSEIQVCSNLFCQMLIEPYPKFLDTIEQGEYDSKVYAFANLAYERIALIAKEKKWYLNLLHYQLFKDLQDKISITTEI
jgi:hypothetical protein